MYDLTRFQNLCLTATAILEQENDESPHGLGIKNRLEQWYGEKVNHGRLYPNLDSLVEDGLIEKGQLDRRTNYYELTQDGRDHLARDRQLLSRACGSGAVDPYTGDVDGNVTAD